jgi:hypothetical protein
MKKVLYSINNKIQNAIGEIQMTLNIIGSDCEVSKELEERKEELIVFKSKINNLIDKV